ncbi:MAG: hypothetical protein JWP96_2581 [Polaromonas sp.]|nr:hypothetical protein [Polaromonas sp.]
MKKWKLALTQGALAGSLASFFSTAVLAVAGRLQTGSAVAPINAVSHWYWGDEALQRQGADLNHTAMGYLTHHSAAIFWATVYAALASNKPALRTTPGLIAGAAATSATAYIADFKFTPHRFTPGYEHRLSTGALAVVYAGFAVGLAAGALALRDHYKTLEEQEERERIQELQWEQEAAPRVIRRVRAGNAGDV